MAEITWNQRFRQGLVEAISLGLFQFLLAYSLLGVEHAAIAGGLAAVGAFGRVMGVAGIRSQQQWQRS